MAEIDDISKKVEKDILNGKIKRKLNFKDWAFIVFVILIAISMVFIMVFKFLKVDAKECSYYPYLQVQHNSTNASDFNFTSWNSKLDIPNSSSFCLGNKAVREVFDNRYNITYNMTECNGNILFNGTYNVKCNTGYYYLDRLHPENLSIMTVCNVLYDCKNVKQWRWKIKGISYLENTEDIISSIDKENGSN
jgi:hypothetical protein